MQRAVFINYRGADSDTNGALLYTELTNRFGPDQVFLDAETIPAGADFTVELLGAVRSARVLLAVIGPRWLTTTGPAGRRRIDDPDDWIRRELVEAFAHGVRVIPILTDHAELPRETDLPADIAALSRCQYRHLRRRESTVGLALLVAELISLEPTLAAAACGRHDTPDHRPTIHTTPAIEEHVRLLAEASWQQWTAAASERRLMRPAPLPIRWRRATVPVAGPASATGYRRFDPLPGLTTVSGGDLADGDHETLHGIYGGLPSGRLLLIGQPGSGKTTAAILLLLDALRYRQHATPQAQVRIPVPVLFTLHGWDPDDGVSVTDWMAGKLAETYPMFRGRTGREAATDLLTTGRIAGILDGLDEIPEPVRPGVLDALADAPFRLVLLTRTTEAVDAAHHGPLAGAIALELQPVHPIDAGHYLLQSLLTPPPTPWQTISDNLAAVETSPTSEALTTPLALSLLRDVYGPADPVDELLDTTRFRTAKDIENHLLDQAITAAYTPRPGRPRPRYTVATADRTLRYLATQLADRDTADLAWWHISVWTPHRARMLTAAVTNLLLSSLIFGLPLGLVFGPALGLTVGLVLGLPPVTMLAISGRHIRGLPGMPRRITRLSCRNASHLVTLVLPGTLLPGLAVGLVVGLVSGFSAGLATGLPVGFAAGLVNVIAAGLVKRTDVEENALGPLDVWRHDRNAGIVFLPVAALTIGLLAALVVALVPGLEFELASRLLIVLSILLPLALMWGSVGGLVAKRIGTAVSSPGTAAADTALAALRLTIRYQTPPRLIAFLEDARRRHLLRTVGPIYQFRHATLQARLAQAQSRRSTGHNALEDHLERAVSHPGPGADSAAT